MTNYYAFKYKRFAAYAEGAVPAKIIFDKDIALQNIYERNLVSEVSIKEPKVYGSGPLKVRAT